MSQTLPTVLIVEDDPALCFALTETLRIADYPVEALDSGDDALLRVKRGGIGLVVTDVNLRGLDGFGVLAELAGRPDMPPVVMMTAYGTIDRAVRAMKGGAVDYLTKPFRPHELLQCIERHLRPPVTDDPIAVDLRSQAAVQMARRIAGADANVFITGESGTGKEVFARFLHRNSPRADKPFVAVNCAAIPDNLIESTLFGHEKGAFTGAHDRQIGLFQRANGGTLLLDEITEIPTALQAKLLRVLQESEVEPIGARQPIPVNVRVIATSNRDMPSAIAAQQFRQDLYFRIGVLPLALPALRERPNDILPLARAFLDRHGRLQRRAVGLATDAETALLEYAWPGNVRELDNVLLRALVLHASDTLHAGDLGLTRSAKPGSAAPALDVKSTSTLDARREREEAEIILRALDAHGGRRAETARALGIAERTLRYRLQKLRERAS